MPYLPARLTAVTTLADLKISGILSADSINHKIAMNSSAGAATDANDHFLFEDGGTDGGGKNAGDYVQKIIGYAGANVVGRFVVPRFGDNFDADKQELVNQDLIDELNSYLAQL